MVKRGVFALVALAVAIALIIVMSSFSYALFGIGETNTSTNTSNIGDSGISSSAAVGDAADSFRCLETRIGNRTDLSLQEAIFSTLALGEKQNLVSVIEKNKKAEGCWPKEACKIKETSQVMLAYDLAGKDSASAKRWVLSKNSSASDLLWYLEIDAVNHEASQCKIGYDSTERTINIGSDMKITGDAGSCFEKAYSDYWLRIRPSCVDKRFEISCDKDFITTLLYQLSGRETIFISSNTHSATSLGTTEEKVNAKCFKTSGSCDYEGTLWAALALQKQGENVNAYLPYLTAFADDNSRYFPSSFLYLIVGGNEQYNNVIQSQKQGNYWEESSGSRYYDSSLGLLSLYGTGANEFDNARNYLLGIRTKDKCWNNNNIRDTAFILYSGWRPSFIEDVEDDSVLCEQNNYFCSTSSLCLSSGGSALYGYDCPGLQTCCSILPQQQSCSSQGGTICFDDEECDGQVVTSGTDGTCCVGTCAPVEEQFTCELEANRICRAECSDNEIELNSESCSSGVCCEGQGEPSEEGSGWIWILLLGILIILVIIGILFRDKIKFWWMRYKGKAKTTPIKRGPPGPPTGFRPMPSFKPLPYGPTRPQTIGPRIMPRQMPSQGQRPAPTPPEKPQKGKKEASERDKEMEETLRKLREMSK